MSELGRPPEALDPSDAFLFAALLPLWLLLLSVLRRELGPLVQDALH